MPGSPKTLRQPPQRRFEDYVLTRVTAPGIGLTEVPLAALQPVPGSPGIGYTDDGLSDLLPIGFDFQIDNVTYKKFIVSTNGWLALAGPTETSSATIESALLTSASYYNQGINLNNSSQNVLLCPWFDDLRNTADKLSSVVTSNDKRRRIQEGLETPPISFRPSDHSVRWYLDERSTNGRRLIVRWNSLSDFSNASTVITFESVLYENGTIEFRYAPRQNITLEATKYGPGPDDFIEDATIGIFMPGTNRFRDFALGLGRSDNRQQYRLGGAVHDPAFADAGFDNGAFEFISRPYVWRLVPALHWPDSTFNGTIFSFSPPKNRRRVLPRLQHPAMASALTLPTVARTGDSRLGNQSVQFDDRRSLSYNTLTTVSGTVVGTIVDYPTTLQRLYGDSSPGVTQRQDLFGGFEVTGSIVKSAVEPFTIVDPARPLEPFTELNRFENHPSNVSSSFFLTGSSLEQLGDGLKQPLKAKTHIKVSFPVLASTQMFGVSSSIYYYNKRQAAWCTPSNASGPSDGSDLNSKSDIASASYDSDKQRVIEDGRGFGPIGNRLSSGTVNRTSLFQQSDPYINSLLGQFAGEPDLGRHKYVEALSTKYGKSVQVNSEYDATADETFTLPINHPFLLEKAVIELPFAAGNGWFQDKTTSFLPLENLLGSDAHSFDFGGPGVTVALFHQINRGTTQRDLVLSGTITHTNDDTHEIVLSKFPPIESRYQLRIRGFRAHSRPTAIVVPTSTSLGEVFTGSVTLNCEAMVSNGVVAKFYRRMTGATADDKRQAILDMFNSPELPVTTFRTVGGADFFQEVSMAYINPLGRGSGDFEASGRSVFGKDFTTSQKYVEKSRLQNPFFIAGAPKTVSTITSGSLSQQLIDAILDGTEFRAVAAIPIESHLPSPYLIRPGDKLVLAVSKTRPFFYGKLSSTPYTSGSVVHDVQMLTGSINITFYGSLLKENAEFHDTLNQPLASDAVHEVVVGNEPVLDQFIIGYQQELSGAYTDDFVTGSLITKLVDRPGTSLTGSLLIGSRSRIFSITNARAAGNPTTPSKAYNLQPWFERAGSTSVVGIDDASERYWDSLMPALATCFNIDNSHIFIPDAATQAHQVYHLTGTFPPNETTIGRIFFDYDAGSIGFNVYNVQPIVINNNWSKSYPFEPRYSSAAKQLDFSKTFIATQKLVRNETSGSFVSIPPTRVETLMPGFVSAHGNLEQGSINFEEFHWLADESTVANLTSSAAIEDTAKAMFGFGDNNNIFIFTQMGGNNEIVGTNHAPTFRASTRDIGVPTTTYKSDNRYRLSPIIRGWKYGVHSGLASFSRAYYRPDRFGQFRDMLEQRPFAKYYQAQKNPEDFVLRQGEQPAAVNIKFVDSTGRLTKPENTWSQNLSFEATSSVPYFDGESRNRPPITTNTLNASIISFNANQFNQITL